jgi:hypothetical protein
MAAFEFAFTLGAGNHYPPALWMLPVAASQDIEVGDALTISSGQLAVAGNGDVIAAIAQEKSDNQAAGTEIRVYIPQPYHVWRAVASADASSNVLDGTDTYDLGTSQVVNLADTSGGGMRIIEQYDVDDNTAIHVQITNAFFGA